MHVKRSFVYLLASLLATGPVFAANFQEMNSQALKDMRAGQHDKAEQVWRQIITAPDVNKEEKETATSNLSCLLRKLGKEAEADALEESQGRKKAVAPPATSTTPKPAVKRQEVSGFQTYPVLNTPGSKRILEQVKAGIVKSLWEKQLTVGEVSDGVVYRLPGEHKGLMCFDVHVTANGVLNARYSYSVSVQDMGDGEINILDKKCITTNIEATDGFKKTVANEVDENRKNQEARAEAERKRAEQDRIAATQKESAEAEAAMQADLAKRQKQNAKSGYFNRY